MGLEALLLQLLNSIQGDLVLSIIKVLLVIFLMMGIKNFLYSLVILLKLKLSDMVSRNQIIEYDGFRGKIIEVKLRGITLENKEGDQMFIHLDRWKYGKLVYPHIDGFTKENNKDET